MTVLRACVVVPARDEAELIARCLASIRDARLLLAGRAAAGGSGAAGQGRDEEVRVVTVVVADDCTDDTAAIAAAVPDVTVVETRLRSVGAARSEGARVAFARLAEKSQIDTRFSVLEPDAEARGTVDGFYDMGRYPSTGTRMARFETDAPALAEAACDALGLEAEGPRITHLVFATCTGFAAPGLDHWLIHRYGLPGHVERTIVGFMGCQAAINALKLARQAVRSDPDARVLVVNLELCSLHLQPSDDLGQLMCFLLFADGCSAALVTGARRPSKIGSGELSFAAAGNGSAALTVAS